MRTGVFVVLGFDAIAAVVEMSSNRIAVAATVVGGVALGVECMLAMTPDGELRVQHRGDEQQGDNRTHVTNLRYHYRLVNMAFQE